MEVKVSVGGVERSVSGLTETTTCAQIIYALAHATGQKGRFVMVERHRDFERTLAPTDRPIEMMRKRDQHSPNVSFILKHLDSAPSVLPLTSSSSCSPSSSDLHQKIQNPHTSSIINDTSKTNASVQASSSNETNHFDALILTSEQQNNSCSGQVLQPFTESTLAQHPKQHALITNGDYSTRCSTGLLFESVPLPSQFSLASESKPSASQRIVSSSSTGCITNVLSAPDAIHHCCDASSSGAHPSWQTQPLYHHQTQSASFIGATTANSSQIGSLKNSRPPPPAYHEVIERRYNSLTRGGTTTNTSSLLRNSRNIAFRPPPDHRIPMNLTSADLERLILNQQRTIDEQKSHLAQLDIAIHDDHLREIIQLERQQANLRLILNPLRSVDWPSRLHAEKLRTEQVQVAIVELQRKIDSIACEIREKAMIEMKINEQIELIQREICNLESTHCNTKVNNNGNGSEKGDYHYFVSNNSNNNPENDIVNDDSQEEDNNNEDDTVQLELLE
ncbi:unnamed protein product [Anisakis simplex]|uniref:Ras-associating domain-containing protein n=1 Tax=Anisakis simplex TaxID=6269 RepID=A0A0M3JTF2_ANISI|nr:unnamed protein product [Anisakis simplex]